MKHATRWLVLAPIAMKIQKVFFVISISQFLSKMVIPDEVVDGQFWTDSDYAFRTWQMENVLTWSIPERSTENYWLGEGESQSYFALKFDKPRIVSLITIVNTHNGDWQGRGTEEFKESLSFACCNHGYLIVQKYYKTYISLFLL